MRHLVTVLVLALLGAGCDSTEPPTPVVRVEISGARALQPGETVQLTATPRGPNDVPLEGREVTWTSSAPGIVVVEPALGRTVTLRAVAPGTATITAISEGTSATATVTVAAPVSASCRDPGAVLNLAVGQTQTVTGAQASVLCLGGTGAEYTVVPFFASPTGTGSMSLEVTATGVQAAAGPPTPSLAPATPYFSLSPLSLSAQEELHTRLRETEIRELTARIPAAREAMAARRAFRASLAYSAPQVGDLLTLNAESNSACETPNNRVGRVAAVTERAIVVADTSNPAGGFTDEDYRQVGIAFDTLVYPVNTLNFGEPTDIDANGRVIIFYTRVVNQLTEPNSESFVGGFFFSRDLFPRTATQRLQACANSNQGEIFYMLVPDPEGVVNQNKRSVDFVRQRTVATVAHEFQHLINAGRRLFVNNARGFETVWLNEGLSHISEELTFYRVSQLGPRQNVDITQIRSTEAIRNAFNTYQVSNHGRFNEYLKNPEGNSPYDADDDLATRGAIWAFLRYAADQRNGQDQPLWFALVNSTTSGLENLRGALGTDPVPLVRDWSVSNYTDDAVTGVEARFTQPSWNYRSIHAAFTSNSGRYPLRTRPLADGVATAVTLKAGAAAFLRLGVAASGVAEVRTTSGQAAPRPEYQVTVVRTR